MTLIILTSLNGFLNHVGHIPWDIWVYGGGRGEERDNNKW